MLGQERESKRRGRQSAADLNLNKSGRNYILVEHKREFWYPCKFSLIEVKKLQQKKYILDILYNYFHICSKKGLVLTKSIQSIQSILFNLNFDWGQTGRDNIKRPMPDNKKDFGDVKRKTVVHVILDTINNIVVHMNLIPKGIQNMDSIYLKLNWLGKHHWKCHAL